MIGLEAYCAMLIHQNRNKTSKQTGTKQTGTKQTGVSNPNPNPNPKPTKETQQFNLYK